jgi:hypothetical protein
MFDDMVHVMLRHRSVNGRRHGPFAVRHRSVRGPSPVRSRSVTGRRHGPFMVRSWSVHGTTGFFEMFFPSRSWIQGSHDWFEDGLVQVPPRRAWAKMTPEND